MADYLIVLAALAAIAAGLFAAWRPIAGPSRSVARLAGRILLVLAVATVVTGLVTYQLSKSRGLQLAGDLVQRVETDQRLIALTFDDGPTPGYTEEVPRTLGAHRAHATFYLIGAACEEHPELARKIVAAGHELGNHTSSHRRLCFVSAGTVAGEIERTDALLRAAGYRGPITFRPPGCKRLLTAPLYLARTHRTTVTWDLEPDSIAAIADDADALADYVAANARPGSIVLLHAMYPSREATRRALPRILERLAAKGYRFVTISELLALRAGQCGRRPAREVVRLAARRRSGRLRCLRSRRPGSRELPRTTWRSRA